MTAKSASPMQTLRMGWGAGNKTFLAVAVTSVLAIGAIGYWLQHRHDPQISLFGETKLLDRELSRMQLAFGESGLNAFELRDGKIFVPQSQRDRFLKALNQHDAIPECSREIYESNVDSPWTTSQQQQASMLLRKKKMIRQLVLQLDFVADAMVDYDELVEDGWPPTTRRSAAVMIRPREGRMLESYQVAAIRNTICGAVAGLSPKEIVITDVAAGHAYVGFDDDREVSTQADLSWLDRAKLEQRIRDQVAPFGPEIETSVTLESIVVGSPISHNDETAEKATSKTPPPSAPVANQPIAIPAANENGSGASPSSPGPLSDRQMLLVQIRIPEHRVRELAASTQLADQDVSQQRPDDPFPMVQARIKAAVQPVLSTSSSRWQQSRIEVVIIPSQNTDHSAAAAALAMRWLGSPSRNTTALVIAGLLMMVGTAWVMVRHRMRASSHGQREGIHGGVIRSSGSSDSRDEPLPDDARLKLQRIVDSDPEQAADIIKQWIREAA